MTLCVRITYKLIQPAYKIIQKKQIGKRSNIERNASYIQDTATSRSIEA